jgi:hypothetical protein
MVVPASLGAGAGRRVAPVLLALAVTIAPAEAQRAPIFLEPGHWSFDAIRRLNAAGVAPAASDPSAAAVTLQSARAVFTHAAAEALRQGRDELSQLAEGYLSLLSALDTTGVLANASLRAGWVRTHGEALGGDGYFVGIDWTGARPLDGTSGPAGAVLAYGWLHSRVAWSIDGGYIGDDWTLPAAAGALAVGPIDVWAGRRRLHYGAGRGGAIVLGSGLSVVPELAHRVFATADGIGVQVREPFYFPWVLRALGPTRVEVVAGRLSRNGLVEAPYVVFGRLVSSPFTRRLTLGVNRGAIFGGEGKRLTLRNLGGLFLGLHNAGFENQVFSVVVRLRPPLGAVPLELYYEGGMDDTAGSFKDVPATIVGFDLGALPGMSAIAAGVEHAQYAAYCCGNTIWYRNVFFRGSWADEGRLFAHPLGGHGRQWLAHLRLDLPQHGLLARAEAFVRKRRRENLYAPEQTGRSFGGSLTLEYSPRAGTALRLDGGFEDGERWRVQRISALVSHTLKPRSR